MNLVATKKHPYVSEGVGIKANIFDAKMLLDRGYAIDTDEAEGEEQKPKQKTKKK